MYKQERTTGVTFESDHQDIGLLSLLLLLLLFIDKNESLALLLKVITKILHISKPPSEEAEIERVAGDVESGVRF